MGRGHASFTRMGTRAGFHFSLFTLLLSHFITSRNPFNSIYVTNLLPFSTFDGDPLPQILVSHRFDYDSRRGKKKEEQKRQTFAPSCCCCCRSSSGSVFCTRAVTPRERATSCNCHRRHCLTRSCPNQEIDTNKARSMTEGRTVCLRLCLL